SRSAPVLLALRLPRRRGSAASRSKSRHPELAMICSNFSPLLRCLSWSSRNSGPQKSLRLERVFRWWERSQIGDAAAKGGGRGSCRRLAGAQLSGRRAVHSQVHRGLCLQGARLGWSTQEWTRAVAEQCLRDRLAWWLLWGHKAFGGETDGERP